MNEGTTPEQRPTKPRWWGRARAGAQAPGDTRSPTPGADEAEDDAPGQTNADGDFALRPPGALRGGTSRASGDEDLKTQAPAEGLSGEVASGGGDFELARPASGASASTDEVLPPADRPKPLHDPDPYSTPPYGEPGPWAPAPPVQHPAGHPCARRGPTGPHSSSCHSRHVGPAHRTRSSRRPRTARACRRRLGPRHPNTARSSRHPRIARTCRRRLGSRHPCTARSSRHPRTARASRRRLGPRHLRAPCPGLGTPCSAALRHLDPRPPHPTRPRTLPCPGPRPAGLKAGDVITDVDGERVHSGDELIVRTRAHRPGDHLRLTLRRDGKEKTVSLVLGSSTGG